MSLPYRRQRKNGQDWVSQQHLVCWGCWLEHTGHTSIISCCWPTNCKDIHLCKCDLWELHFQTEAAVAFEIWYLSVVGDSFPDTYNPLTKTTFKSFCSNNCDSYHWEEEAFLCSAFAFAWLVDILVIKTDIFKLKLRCTVANAWTKCSPPESTHWDKCSPVCLLQWNAKYCVWSVFQTTRTLEVLRPLTSG